MKKFFAITILIYALSSTADGQSFKGQLAAELEDHLKVFLSEKDFDTKKITADVKKGRELVDRLSDLLSMK